MEQKAVPVLGCHLKTDLAHHWHVNNFVFMACLRLRRISRGSYPSLTSNFCYGRHWSLNLYASALTSVKALMIHLKRTGNRHAIKRIIKPNLTTPNKRDVNKDHEGKMACAYFRISFAMLAMSKDKGFTFLKLTTSLCRANKCQEVLVLCHIP